MTKSRVLLLVVSLMVTLCGIIGLIVYLVRARLITFEMGLLMLVALLGFYIGFGVLIFVYRMINRLN